MKRLALWLWLTGALIGLHAQTPDSEFLQIYRLIQAGETHEAAGEFAQAMDRYQEARRELDRFARANPTWNRRIVQFRLGFLGEKVGALKLNAPAEPVPAPLRTVTPSPASPASPAWQAPSGDEAMNAALAVARAVAADALARAHAAESRADTLADRTAQMALDLRDARDRLEVFEASQQNLERTRRQLENQRATLQAKLDEALRPRPAAIDPVELARVHDRNLLLIRENEILKAALDHQAAQNRRLVETASKALELERQWTEARSELAAQKRELDALREERRRLLARVETLSRRDESQSEPLRAEVASLRRQLDEARAEPPSPEPGSEDLRRELAAHRTAAEELRRENFSLLREIEKLTAIRVTPASLKPQEVLSDDRDLAAAGAVRARRLERERDELLHQLELTQAELQRGNPARVRQLEREVDRLDARLRVLTAPPEPYTDEERALFRQPVEREILRPLQLAQAAPTETPPPPQPPPAPVETAPPAPAPVPPARETPSHPTPAQATAAPETATTDPSAPRRRTARDLPAGAGILAQQAHRAFLMRRFDEAEAGYREILKLDEDNIFTLGNLAAILVEKGRIEEGEALLDRALRLDQDDPFSLSLMGIIRFRQQRYDEAFDTLSRSARIDPDNADTQNYLGITLSQRGQRQAAETALRRALKLNPASPAAHYNLAVVYATQRPPFLELARYHYEKARRAGQPPNPAFEGVLRGEEPPAAEQE
ncbi:MAG: tetratricopeptide repeat protein [Verrucomicrobiae bacterium]|nr:tetratricopeptide repeat protein [Verrucomicrobiae bacterium]